MTQSAIGGDNSSTVTETYYIAPYGVVEKVEKAHSGGSYKETFKYDYLGNTIERKSPRAYEEKWTPHYTEKYEYDYAGRLTKSINNAGKSVTTEYDTLGRKIGETDFKGYRTGYTYDDAGRLIEEKLPLKLAGTDVQYSIQKHYYDLSSNLILNKITKNKPGEAAEYNQTTYEYNKRNLLTKVTTYNGTTPENYTQYYYDAAGNRLRMYTGLNAPLSIIELDNVQPGSDADYSVTKYEYNPFGLLTKTTAPNGEIESYTYDTNSNLTNMTDKKGNPISFSYDGLGRMTSKSATANGITTTYSYTYNNAGQRATMTGGGIDTAYYYNDQGLLSKEVLSNGITKEYQYNANGSRVSFVVKKDAVEIMNTTYEYNDLDRLEYVYENGQLVATYSYDDNGNRLTLTYPNGITTAYGYNLANQLTSLSNRKGTQVLSEFSYTHYLDGNQESKTDAAGTTQYVYDGLGRIEMIKEPQGVLEEYGYDDICRVRTFRK